MRGGWRIGLTGGIGSGKSTVARSLSELGAAVIDADAISRELTLPGGAAIEPLRRSFGNEFIAADGSLDRDRMRALAFADPQAKQRLEGIIHPLVGAETEARAAAAIAPAIVFDVPLLVESGRWRARVDRVWVVDCREDTQVARVMARSGWAEEDVRRVMVRQASRRQRLAAADVVIHNEGIGLPRLQSVVAAFWHAELG